MRSPRIKTPLLRHRSLALVSWWGQEIIMVYAGDGTNVTVTGLLPDTECYHLAIYEQNGAGSSLNYLQDEPLREISRCHPSNRSTIAFRSLHYIKYLDAARWSTFR